MTRSLIKPRPLSISKKAKARLRILYIAKHALSRGDADGEDGTHATYHAEIRDVLTGIGLNLSVADSYEALFGPVDADFVFPLLNRGGFLNSEMMLPLLCNRLGLPYLGGSPIVRGLSDDKHLTKTVARARGLKTADWAIYRRMMPIKQDRCPRALSYVVKPNASSASWGVSRAYEWQDVRDAVAAIHADGHDAIVEPFITGHDIEVSVITVDGKPVILPTMIVEQEDPSLLRSYAEKRNLVDGQAYAIQPFNDHARLAEIEAATRALLPEYMPFDYGRFEFRLDVTTGAVHFLEVNLNCNLWSRKTIAMAARLGGWSHAELIETIVAESLHRHGLIEARKPKTLLPVWQAGALDDQRALAS
ncbi:phosphoribosylglycinamide synthetase [Sphingomonas sp. BIUV-7]|uniref:Phosphoribosylglycinamide synthetase n=1 Tax=Sphingomonas natans TaxID=3063330 RepID=A0ABT8YAW0_9SPHN|nr:phosphoribosylglycinamide synthetase [Sphingomonas sp. BIUV-7]MDO6414973.1 phosphoribosylglycinamide synthetase [Sphingomonas sp. BIUV-7]